MFFSPKVSLKGLLGADYMDAVIEGAALLSGMEREEAERLADEEVDFLPEGRLRRCDGLLEKVGARIAQPLRRTIDGAPTDSFRGAAHNHMAPVGAYGCMRLGEDGRLYLIGKSEHYHASLGHDFPGYRLIQNAQRLGIDNTTHNNTRGYITRLAEREVVRAANGLGGRQDAELERVLASKRPKVVNRVINLETGSLAVEAGIKMMLARFYRLDASFPEPKYSGKIPVFFVLGDLHGGLSANYHGTTVLAQTFRGLWPDFREGAGEKGLYRVVPVSVNDASDFREKMLLYNKDGYKTAGFLHEIILMNYGAVRLTPEYLRACYEMCADSDTPVLCDEIQSCMWYPGMFLFRLYGLKPDFIVIGKGFPGGQYPASKILTTFEMDCLNQFGALVTNGQEELASLAYLITMRFAMDNAERLGDLGKSFQDGVARLAQRHPALVSRAEGLGHLAALHFFTLERAAELAGMLNARCIDISAQTYKAECPPAVLFKPPLTASPAALDYLLNKLNGALDEMEAKA